MRAMLPLLLIFACGLAGCAGPNWRGHPMNSNEVSIEVSAAPMPPSGLTISVT